MPLQILLVTFPDPSTASRITRILVEEQLVACGNILPGLTSIYRWEGKICEESEVLVLYKSLAHHYPAFEKRILELHPYQIPEIIAVSADQTSSHYLAWVLASTRSSTAPTPTPTT